MSAHEFTAGFLFCGLGAGARGFLDAMARLGPDTATFRSLGGVDIDPASCEDFEYLTGSPGTVADLSTMQPADLLKAWGPRRPDCIFLSPPCKGFSGLLSSESSKKPKYQALNRLVLQGIFLALETWDAPPPMIVIENVPRIASRGKALLDQVKQVLGGYEYLLHESTHDCGELGGLAQHRKRYLMVARRPDDITGYVNRPPRRRVRACGEVLEQLPMPEDAAAGELHRLPKLSWLNWVRLSLIPAGGDWRDLPKGPVTIEGDPTREGSFKGRPDAYGVQRWTEPAKAVRGKMVIAHAPAAVADPRAELISPVLEGEERRKHFRRHHVAAWDKPAPTVAGSGSNAPSSVADPRVEKRNGAMGVVGWNEPTGVIAGESYPSNGKFSVADPRIGLDHEPRRGSYGVKGWTQPADTVRGNASVRQSSAAVADPRPYANIMPVVSWEGPARTVVGATRPGGGALSVADPRVELPTENPNRHWNKYAVEKWDKPARTVMGATRPGSGSMSVADPRLGCKPRAGVYGVMSWTEAASTITGNARVDNGKFAIADVRKPPEGPVPVIISEDGCWHRPLTTLELAALQGIPVAVNGKPLALAGRSIAKWRERIGNAVPVGTAAAIAETILTALLASALGVWTVGGGSGVWVRDDGITDEQVNAPFLALDCGGLHEAA